MQTADSYNLPLQYAYGPIFKNTIDRAYPYAYAQTPQLTFVTGY